MTQPSHQPSEFINPDARFIEAVIAGDRKQALHWLNKGAAIDGPQPGPYNKAPQIPLIEAVRNNKPLMIQWLIDYGANVQARDYLGDTALHKAAHSGNLNAATLLLEAGAEVNPVNGNRTIPLHQASINNDVPMTRLLMQRGGDPDMRDRSGRNAIRMTSNPDILDILMGRPTPSTLISNALDRPVVTTAPESGPDRDIFAASLAFMIQQWRDNNPGPDALRPEM